MEHKLILGLLLAGMVMLSGCTQPAGGQSAVNQTIQPSPQKNETPISNGTAEPTVNPLENKEVHYISKDAKVTISDASCTTVELYRGLDAINMADKGAKYAKTYRIQVSGSMSGSENASLSVSTKPAVQGGYDLSCGGWSVNNALVTCTRTDFSLSEASKWSYHVDALGESVAVDPGQKIIITAKASIGNAEGEAKATVYCPFVDYD
jgi:hypothetical protein